MNTKAKMLLGGVAAVLVVAGFIAYWIWRQFSRYEPLPYQPTNMSGNAPSDYRGPTTMPGENFQGPTGPHP